MLAIPNKLFGEQTSPIWTAARSPVFWRRPIGPPGTVGGTTRSYSSQSGLRLTELTSLKISDVHLGDGAYVHCLGKGRKDRRTPLNAATVRVLKAWLRDLSGVPEQPLFPTRWGTALSPDAVESLVSEHARSARQPCPSLEYKKVTPHVLRHTTAMQLLHAGVDPATIALWLGHERVQTTDMYLHADMSMKERALARLQPIPTGRGRYKPSDALMSFLEGR